jgi:hypothetical protein
MVSSFAKEIGQLSLAANIITPDLLSEIGSVLGRYFKESLGAGTYEVRINAPMGSNGERYLSTLWSASGPPSTMPLVNADGSIRGHTSYAVLKDKPLWVLCSARGALNEAKTYDDQWSKAEALPPYRGWPDGCYHTEIVVPIGTPPNGFLNLEFEEALDCSKTAKDELQRIAAAIDTFCGLYKSYDRQITNTKNAIRNVTPQLTYSPLRKPKLFFAFSGIADEEVVGLAKEVLGEFTSRVVTISWDEMQQSGNINAQITQTLTSSTYGLCYLSEPSGEPGCYKDNPNVVFEAGMFHALTSDQQGQTRWIPMREKGVDPAPFDFAHDRMLTVPRDDQARLNTQKLRTELCKRLKNLL